MRWRAVHLPVLLLASVLILSLTACAPSQDDAEDPAAALWSEIEQMQSELAAKRAEIDEARGQLDAASAKDEADDAGDNAGDDAATAEGEAEEGAEAAPTAEELEARVEQLTKQASEMSQALYEKLIEYINTSGIIEGEPLTPEQRQAFDWKAEEDIRIAQEYIDKGGDYSRAIDIYDASLMSDPESQLLLDAKAEAERLQYMTEERFAAVEKGMTQDEVRELLGTVNQRNVREYEDDGTVGWFYRREDGGAAGVFFQERKGEWQVVVADFDAAKPPSATGESEE